MTTTIGKLFADWVYDGNDVFKSLETMECSYVKWERVPDFD